MEEKLKKIIYDKKVFKYIYYLLGSLSIIIMLLNLILKDNNNFMPVYYSNVITTWYYMLLYLGYFSLIVSLYYMYLKRSEYKVKLFIPGLLLILFFIWVVITTLLSNNIMVSLIGHEYRKEGLFTYIAYIGYLLGAMLASNEEKNKFYKLFVIAGVILSLFTIFKCNFTNMFIGESSEYKAIFHQFNHFGYYLLMAIICSISLIMNSKNKKEKILYFMIYIILLVTLTFNDTFGSYLAVFGSLIFLFIYYYFINKEKVLSVIILIIFIICSFIPTSIEKVSMFEQIKDNVSDVLNINSKIVDNEDKKVMIDRLGTSRGRLWRCAIEIIKERPILGYGLDNIESEMNIRRAGNDRPHNIMIQMWAYTGLPGMLLYEGSILMILFMLFKRVKKLPFEVLTSFSVILGYFISSLTANSMYYIVPYYMLFLGFSLGELYKDYIIKKN